MFSVRILREDGVNAWTMSHRLTKEELDKQFELFLKESVSDDSADLASGDKESSTQSGPKSGQRAAVSWWEDEEFSSRGGEKESLGSGKTFKRFLKKSRPIQEEELDPEDPSLKKNTPLLRDDTGREANTANKGLDTLEEEEEKAKFFALLEAEASIIDYSKLNRELDSTTSTLGTNLRKSEDASDQEEHHDDNADDGTKAKVPENAREFSSSPHYSEDFEEEGDHAKEPPEEKSEVSQILAKVSLYDSLDDTGGEDRGKDTAAESLDTGNTGHACVQSGASETEALHEAYRQIHVRDSDVSLYQIAGSQSLSPTPLARDSLQPSSTKESDLPTAEELMRTIRPEQDHVRGFSLQPVSGAKPLSEKTVHFLEGTFPVATPSQSKHSGDPEPAAGIPRPNSSEPSDHNQTWCIKQEVERLMEDHNKFTSSKPSKAPAACTQVQVSHRSTFPQPSPSSVRRTTVSPVKPRRAEGRTGMTSRTSGRGRTAATARTQPAVPRPAQQSQEKNQVKSQDQDEDLGMTVSSGLVASVQSLVAILQQQIDTNSHQTPAGSQNAATLQNLPTDNGENGPLVEELRLQLAVKEKELRVMKDGAEELKLLQQQNYVLQSKLRCEVENNQKKALADVTDSAREERIQQMNKEIKEQEVLIKGYQQENEKLYMQLRAQKTKSKANEGAMFSENQRLLSELALTKEQLKRSSESLGSVCPVDFTRRIEDLSAQIIVFQRNEVQLSEEIGRLNQEKQALTADLKRVKNERDQLKAQALSASGDRVHETHALQDKHEEEEEEEVASLKKKLQWFTENRALLDRDTGRLKAATAEIQQLKEQVEKLKTQVSKRGYDQQRKTKEKIVAMKRTQDLERQVKELEQILKSRNPNSLPALIYAVANADKQNEASPPSSINALLERRIQHLEAELERHEEEAKRSMRAMEQQFQRIKLCYEQQISSLEKQLEQKQQQQQQQQPGVENATAAAARTQTLRQSLEEKLQREKKAHLEKEASLQKHIESLRLQLKQKTDASPGRRQQRRAEEALGARLERLNQELATKTHTIQELSRTVERLQRERRHMLSNPSGARRAEPSSADSRRQPRPARVHSPAAAEGKRGGEETFPAAQYEKTYQPTVFTDTHISEVLQENEALQQRLQLLEQHCEQDKEALKAGAEESRAELCRLQEDSAHQLSSLRAQHLKALDGLRAAHALEHSSSKVAQLTNQLRTQQITVSILRDQLTELQPLKDALALSRTREDTLQNQLTRLIMELKEAREAQSPVGKLLSSLQKKIVNMELKQQHREQELQQVIIGSMHVLEADQQQSEVALWKRLAQEKSRELEGFRLELDSILDILRHLQSARWRDAPPLGDPQSTKHR
ncbi:centrosomal protein of 162 kDa [Nelusetta ayraudi]|uniref:centrosomal protein of 162 kDa n=1 Tax=Nelusetta ayraudi TaxID=303726 RepID=UPI003F715746